MVTKEQLEKLMEKYEFKNKQDLTRGTLAPDVLGKFRDDHVLEIGALIEEVFRLDGEVTKMHAVCIESGLKIKELGVALNEEKKEHAEHIDIMMGEASRLSDALDASKKEAAALNSARISNELRAKELGEAVAKRDREIAKLQTIASERGIEIQRLKHALDEQVEDIVEERLANAVMAESGARRAENWGGPSGADTKNPPVEKRKHSHYFKPCPYDEIDVYRLLEIFNVTSHCLGHAVKKILVAGGRGAGKDIRQDIQEAIDTLQRWQEMRKEGGDRKHPQAKFVEIDANKSSLASERERFGLKSMEEGDVIIGSREPSPTHVKPTVVSVRESLGMPPLNNVTNQIIEPRPTPDPKRGPA